MASRRIAFLLGMASILVMSLVGTSQTAWADTGPTATTKIIAAPEPGSAATCSVSITSFYNHKGAYICGTHPRQALVWIGSDGSLFEEDVVVGTNFRVYHDAGNNWSVLQSGAVLSSAPVSQMGVDLVNVTANSYTIRVFGTSGHRFCDTTDRPFHWLGWTTAGCPQS